jgi:hypothetical protein
MKPTFSFPQLHRGFCRLLLAAVMAVGLTGSFAQAQSEPSSNLLNLSVRTKLNAGDNFVVGFVVAGDTPVRVLVRAVGPTLANFGVTDAMANPKIKFSSVVGPNIDAQNDDWSSPEPLLGSINVATLSLTSMENAFPLPPGSKDAALLVELRPGPYLLTISGSTASDQGTVLAEIYHLNPGSERNAGRLINVSVRATTSANAPLLGGFVTSGPVDKKILVRVAGPILASFGVVGASEDTRLDLMNQDGTIIRSNDNWDSGPVSEVVELRQAFTKSGAFAYKQGVGDAAAIVNIPAGSYTLRGSTVSGASGIILLEIYELPN